jgi:hypothetical protein
VDNLVRAVLLELMSGEGWWGADPTGGAPTTVLSGRAQATKMAVTMTITAATTAQAATLNIVRWVFGAWAKV